MTIKKLVLWFIKGIQWCHLFYNFPAWELLKYQNKLILESDLQLNYSTQVLKQDLKK